MSKELKSFDRIKNYQILVDAEKDEVKTIAELLPSSCDAIETALKDYEELKSLKLLPYPQKNGEEYRQDVIKRLTALEIIKEKRINLEYLKCCKKYKQYCLVCSYGNEITQEEFDLVKEVLENV